MVVELIGGCADGTLLDVPEPPIHCMKIIKHSEPLIGFHAGGPIPNHPTPVENYYYIPGKSQYAVTSSPQWRKYMDEVRERISQLLAEEEDNNGT